MPRSSVDRAPTRLHGVHAAARRSGATKAPRRARSPTTAGPRPSTRSRTSRAVLPEGGDARPLRCGRGRHPPGWAGDQERAGCVLGHGRHVAVATLGAVHRLGDGAVARARAAGCGNDALALLGRAIGGPDTQEFHQLLPVRLACAEVGEPGIGLPVRVSGGIGERLEIALRDRHRDDMAVARTRRRVLHRRFAHRELGRLDLE